MEILDEFDVAELFNVPVRCVTKWTRAGILPHFALPNKATRYFRSSIESWAKQLEHA